MTSALKYGAAASWEQNEFLVVYNRYSRSYSNWNILAQVTEFTRKYFGFKWPHNSRFEIMSSLTNMSDESNKNDCVLSSVVVQHSDCKREVHFQSK